MKIITPEMKPEDVEPGDRFLNTTITARSKVIYLPDKTNPNKKRPYLKAQCDCGNMVEGKVYPYARWDRVHTKDANLAPHTMRCSKCSAGGKSRGMPTIWLNTAKSENEISMNNFNDLRGLYFGDLFVKKCVGTHRNSHRIYECICSCGNHEIVEDTQLKSYKVACSECLKSMSAGETIIKQQLDKAHVKYKKEYSFPDLLGEGNKPLRFDFCIFDKDNNIKILIEFQGKQHYEPIEYFGGQEQFKKQTHHDNLKRQYCKKYNYKLLEIPYTASIERIQKMIFDIL